ncbi:MAG: hypothetical protein EAZ88_21710 [Oscillatoriales cyanobacterium]|nr:MAG: hypothetical protein EAZ88_21710 [Oscillatoriales cyanobacterium]
MSKNRIITLLTDFGLSDVYVGVMKGAIAQINPQLQVIDITHQIPSQNIAAARFCLMAAFAYFPAETVHVAVVDPGVGSNRRAVAVKCASCFLVGPDNGLFSGVLSREMEELGRAVSAASLVQLEIPNCAVTATGATGCVQYVDRFGNLITNIPNNCIIGNNWSVIISNSCDLIRIPSGKTYSDSKPGDLIAIIGSDGWLEIAVNGGSAQSVLQLEVGDKIEIILSGS